MKSCSNTTPKWEYRRPAAAIGMAKCLTWSTLTVHSTWLFPSSHSARSSSWSTSATIAYVPGMAGERHVPTNRDERSPASSGGTKNVANGVPGVDSLKNARVAVRFAAVPPALRTSTENSKGWERPETNGEDGCGFHGA